MDDATTVLTRLVEAGRISVWFRPAPWRLVWELDPNQQSWPSAPGLGIRRRVRRAYATLPQARVNVLRLARDNGAVLTPLQESELL
jgi:hypothetical protein